MLMSSFMSHGTAAKSFRFLKNRDLYRCGAVEAQTGGSEWVWDCTVVIHDHNMTSLSTRDLHHEPSWSPVRLNCAPLRSEKSADFGRQDGRMRG